MRYAQFMADLDQLKEKFTEWTFTMGSTGPNNAYLRVIARKGMQSLMARVAYDALDAALDAAMADEETDGNPVADAFFEKIAAMLTKSDEAGPVDEADDLADDLADEVDDEVADEVGPVEEADDLADEVDDEDPVV